MDINNPTKEEMERWSKLLHMITHVSYLALMSVPCAKNDARKEFINAAKENVRIALEKDRVISRSVFDDIYEAQNLPGKQENRYINAATRCIALAVYLSNIGMDGEYHSSSVKVQEFELDD